MTWKHYSLEQTATRFDNSRDYTIGIEEEFQILDPNTLELTSRLEDLKAIAHKKLGTFVQGELIASEVEISTGKCENIAAAEADLTEKRRRWPEPGSNLGVSLEVTGPNPFAGWQPQRIPETNHSRTLTQRGR